MYLIQLPITTYRQHAVMFQYPCTATQHHVHVTGMSEASGTTHGVAVVYTHVTGASEVRGALPIVALASEATCRYICSSIH